jgi:hypothetical protein
LFLYFKGEFIADAAKSMGDVDAVADFPALPASPASPA